MEPVVIKPILVVYQFVSKPFWKLPKMINELSVQVLNATLNFALILRVRRMSKESLNTMETAPLPPLIPKLWPMIRQNSLRKSLLFS